MKKLTTLKPKKTKTIEVKSEAKSTSCMTIRSITTLFFAITRSWKPNSSRLLLSVSFRKSQTGARTRLWYRSTRLRARETWLPSHGTRSQRQGTRILPKATSPSRPRCRLGVGDMTDFSFPEKFDAAINPLNTFRHLTTEAQAVKHLKLVAQHLRPGGIYILGLHLLPPDADLEGTERWTVKQGKTKATFSLSVIDSSRRTRIENLKITMNIHRPSGKIRLVDEFPLRMYSASQIKSLFAKVPEFKLHSTYDFWYEIDEPQTLNNDLSTPSSSSKKPKWHRLPACER